MKIITLLMALVFMSLLTVSNNSIAQDGLIRVKSDFSVAETADRFERLIVEKGLTLFTRIDHAENASGVDLQLPPTELILFGNPKVGTRLMQCQPSVAIDLPQKALVWQDGEQVWLAYNDPKELKVRHQIENCDELINKVSELLSKLSLAATTAK